MNQCLESFFKTKMLVRIMTTAAVTSIMGGLILLNFCSRDVSKGRVWANQICETEKFQSGFINTAPDTEEDVIVIGHLPNHNYVVVVPGQGEELLARVRVYIPDAFRSSSRLGRYIHAGAFETRHDARSLVLQLRSCNIRARLVYFQGGQPI